MTPAELSLANNNNLEMRLGDLQKTLYGVNIRYIFI